MSNEHVLLLGPPGAGKGTQSKRLAAEFDLEHVTTGDALRANKHMETEYGTPASFMDEGELVPDPVVNEIVKTALEDADGYVLDGYPRNLDQVEYLDSVTELDYVFYLAVDEDELVRRLTGRRVCPDCGATFHTEFDQPEEEGVCDECGSALTQRDDDTEETVRERLRVYHENTAPVVEHYRDEGTLVEIEGEGTPDEVFDRLATELRD